MRNERAGIGVPGFERASGVRILVTGVAGFIGSTLAERLLEEGHSVLGVDSFTDYYPRAYKERNLSGLRPRSSFTCIEADLSETPRQRLDGWMQNVDAVSHQAAQAGVRASWGDHFSAYTRYNVFATQQLLEAAKRRAEEGRPLSRFVYASSSSVYGNAREFPLREEMSLHPVSPYGVTKLAAEHLASLYWSEFGIPTVSLRYFTVYGPRQRPDMAFHKLIRAALLGELFPLYGDGEQSRNFTYIDDVVEANVQALVRPGPSGWGAAAGGTAPPGASSESVSPASTSPVGGVFNIGGGARVRLNEVIELLKDLVQRPIRVECTERRKGDVDRTEADVERAERLLGYRPRTDLRQGLTRQVADTIELLEGKG